MPQRPDPGIQAPDVRRLAAARQRPLVMRGLRDRPRAPRRRPSGQFPLTRRPGVRTVLQTIRTTGLEITGRQRTLMRTDRTQHPLVLGREVLETVPDRHPARPRRHERRRQFPQPTHHITPALKAAPLPPSPTSSSRQGHPFGSRTPVPTPRTHRQDSLPLTTTHFSSANRQQLTTPCRKADPGAASARR